MKCTTTLLSAVRVPLLLHIRAATFLSSSTTTTTTSIFRDLLSVKNPPIGASRHSYNMKSTRRQSRSLQTKRDDDTNDTKPPVKKKAKAVKKAAAKVATEVPSTSTVSEDGTPWYSFFTKGDAIYEAYMANEWGYEKHSDQELFEKLCLEGAQAGLTWRTILHKREAYRHTFHNFHVDLVAVMTPSDVERIINESPIDPKNTTTVIVRHKAKVESVIHNAKRVLQMKKEHAQNDDSSNTAPISEVFAHYLWSFVDHKPILNYRAFDNHASTSVESEAMSASLKKYGFKFVGPTTCYSLMQATGMVIDHPYNSPEWNLAHERLKNRPGGYQDRK